MSSPGDNALVAVFLALKKECPQGQALQATGTFHKNEIYKKKHKSGLLQSFTCCSHLGQPFAIILCFGIIWA